MSAKLVVISGPNRGATYFLEEGENFLGRGAENNIVLASTQVSKKHFSIQVNQAKAELKDQGSSNGTFVNGVLAKKRLLKNHDRVSVGPFVMEVILPEPVKLAESFKTAALPPGAMPEVHIDPGQFKMEDEEPTSLVGRYKKKFDNVFLPVLYDFYEKMDYPTLLGIMFSVYVLLSLGFAVYPVLERSREEVMRQAEQQAKYIANQVAFLNHTAIQEGREGNLMTDFAESEVHVKEVVIANMEGRILAPGNRLNEAYNNPTFVGYKRVLEKNQSIWGQPKIVRDVDKEEIIAFSPVMVLSAKKGINVPVAVATVVYSTGSLSLDSGTISSVYLEALFWSAIVGVVFLYLIYHVTHKPIEHLIEDMDKVLKGEGQSVEKKYKNDVIDKLIDNVNSALGRIPQVGGGGAEEQAAASDTEAMIIGNMMRTVEYLAENSRHAMLMLDLEMRIKMCSGSFEELTGIRGAQGEVLEAVSRDESFPSLIKEMVGKSVDAGNEGVHEDYDFPSAQHKIHGYALSGVPGRIEGYLFLFEKLGD